MLDAIDPRLMVKTLGAVAGFLLIGYGFVLAGAGRYDPVSNRYASRLATAGLALVFVALGGFLAGSLTALVLEGTGYLAAGLGGTLVFRRMANNKHRYEKA